MSCWLINPLAPERVAPDSLRGPRATFSTDGVLYGVWEFLVARLLWGTAWSFIRLEGLSTALDVASDQTRGRFLGRYQAISPLGGAVAMLAGGILHDRMGFRATFIVFCGAGRLMLAAVVYMTALVGRTDQTPVQSHR